MAAAEWGQGQGLAGQQPLAGQQTQVQAGQQVQHSSQGQQVGEWQTHYSEGRGYYYNTTTGETRWA